MVMKKRYPSLKIVFLEYLVTMAVAVGLAALVPAIFYDIGINAGWFTYANSAEIQAKAAESQIAAAEIFDSSLVPASCGYVYLNSDESVRESNLEGSVQKKAVDFAKGEYNPGSLDECYLLIKRNDGICVLYYTIRSHYKIEWMSDHFPNPDIVFIVIIVFNCLVACFLVTTFFARRLRKQLRPLEQATRKIREQDLDFEIQPSKIKEFNEIIVSVDSMKTELKQSLEKQWRMEQARREQTSALAHDIKTPLTIIRGNGELLKDSNLTDEQQEYTRYILKNTDRMEQYLKMLIDLTKTEAGSSLTMTRISTDGFIKDLIDQAEGLAAAKQAEVKFVTEVLPQEFTGDAVYLRRALMNVISNAVDFSGEHGTVSVTIQTVKNHIRFCIVDSGRGFLKIELQQATQQFYMGESSRSSRSHYGMGLYIAKSIAELHGGMLEIANSSQTGGGQVTIEIPFA